MAFGKLIFASLRRQRALYILWVLSLAASVSGLLIVDVFRHSLTYTLQEQGRDMLTADAALSTRRLLSEPESRTFRSNLPADARFARLTEMFAMVSAGTESRLGLVRFISDEFPLLGELKVDDRAVHGKDLGEGAWVANDLLALLDVKVGDPIKLGNAEVRIAGIVKSDSSQTFRFGNMAPRIYVHRDRLIATGLVQYGSTLTDSIYAALPVPPASGLKAELEKKFSDAAIQITVPADLEQGSLRLLSQLLDYLGLTGLITLTLGWIGVYYLGRRWLTLETLSSGALKCLGMSSVELRRLLLIKLMIILAAGVLLGGVGAWFAAHALLPLVRDSLPAEFTLVWSWKNTLMLLVIGPLAGWLLLYQAVTQVAFAKPLELFQERSEQRALNPRALLLLIALVAGLFLSLTLMQARSWRVTGAFIGGLSGSVILIVALAYGFLRAVRAYRGSALSWRAQLITALWTRRLPSSLLLITVSALAGLLSQLLPHLEKTLVGELKSPEGVERPSIFMVDIQDEQVDPLKKYLTENNLEISKEAPFIRARILTVNGAEFERGQTGTFSTREEENEARFRNRGVNLSYRKDLSESEKVIAGKDWKDLKSDPAEIAVEERYAQRLGLNLKDILKFDVQGIEIEAQIASIRKIDWNTFEPNFFIQFPDGVLNEAPKTWLMAVKKREGVKPTQMQTLVTKKFPNITSINIEEVVDNVGVLVTKLGGGLRMSSRLSLALGVFVFLMILLFQLVSGRRDWRQLLVLGLTSREVWTLQVLSYGLLCLLGTALGALLSFAVAWGLFHFAFESRAEFDLPGMAQVWLITWGTTIVGLSWLGWRELRRIRGGLQTLE